MKTPLLIGIVAATVATTLFINLGFALYFNSKIHMLSTNDMKIAEYVNSLVQVKK